MRAPLVYSAVLTYNNFVDTDECLESLARQTYPNQRIVVVNNASSDGSLEWLREKWGERVHFLANSENLGCGGGYAEAMKFALKEGAEFVAIIDNDVVCDPDLLAVLLAALQTDDAAALSAPVITFYDRPERVWYAGGQYNSLFGLTRHSGLGRDLSYLSLAGKGPSETDYAPSCAVLIPRKAIESIGLPDARLFFGHDDIDWCLRAREAGFKCLLVPRTMVRHKVSTTGGRRGSTVFTNFSAYHHAKGSLLIGRKHSKGAALAVYLLGQVCIRFPYYSLQMLREGRLLGPAAYLAGMFAGLRFLGPAGHESKT